MFKFFLLCSRVINNQHCFEKQINKNYIFRIHPSYTISPPPVNTTSNSNIFFAPKPFKSLEPSFERCQSIDERNGNSYNYGKQQEQLLMATANSVIAVKQRSVSFKSCTALSELPEFSDQDRESNCSSPPAPPIPKR